MDHTSNYQFIEDYERLERNNARKDAEIRGLEVLLEKATKLLFENEGTPSKDLFFYYARNVRDKLSKDQENAA